MRTLRVIVLSLLLLAGCASRTTYIEGTSLAVGAYLPVEGNLYGCEIASYLSGCRVSAPTNRTVFITRISTSSNSWFGVIHSSTATDTTVEVQ
nr:MAG TPA: TRAF PROTEIN, TRAO PROTEIN, TRAN ADHESION, BACTERIAL SECRETION.5A [Caudoviricetes sp.]